MALQGVCPRQLHVSRTHDCPRRRSSDWPTSSLAWRFVASESTMTVPGRLVLEVLRSHRHLLCRMKPKHLDKREVFNSEFFENWYFIWNFYMWFVKLRRDPFWVVRKNQTSKEFYRRDDSIAYIDNAKLFYFRTIHNGFRLSFSSWDHSKKCYSS